MKVAARSRSSGHASAVSIASRSPSIDGRYIVAPRRRDAGNAASAGVSPVVVSVPNRASNPLSADRAAASAEYAPRRVTSRRGPMAPSEYVTIDHRWRR